jgi:endogenous inhibitor of DNA gyrase (YacG/DUF329 family)
MQLTRRYFFIYGSVVNLWCPMDAIDFKWLHSPGAFRVMHTGAEPRQPSRRKHSWQPGPPGQPYFGTEGRKWFDLYAPTEIPALFQKFADAPHTAEGMCDFFNAYGPLDLAGDRRSNPLSYPQRSLSAGLWGCSFGLREPLAEHVAFRHAVKLHEEGDLSALVELFNRGWGQLQTELRLRGGSKIEIVFTPTNLIHFIWLQFSLFVASGAKLLRCERCSEPIVVGSGTGRRETSKFCSNRCKTADFKERREGRHSHA